jgi:transcriptional regulator with XRE-family HTH domain
MARGPLALAHPRRHRARDRLAVVPTRTVMVLIGANWRARRTDFLMRHAPAISVCVACHHRSMVSGSVGERIAAYRRRRGLSQATLAALVGRSESWLSQVERGVRSADRFSVLVDMAKVLRVDVESLTGQPVRPDAHTTASDTMLDAVRCHFDRYDVLLDQRCPALAPTALQTLASGMHERYQAAAYEQLMGELPGLLSAADVMLRGGGSVHRRNGRAACGPEV